MDTNNSFGKKLQQIRKSKNLTQARLAELADVHEKHISKLELGTYMPNLTTLNKVLKALNINLADIISIEPNEIPINNNQLYIKSLQILNSASEEEQEFYYGLLKQAQKGLELLKKNSNLY